MQLKHKHLRHALAAASCTLLGPGAAQAADEWSFDSALLIYSEPDRVTAIEPVVQARWDKGDDEFMSFRLTVDVLSGPSANGAVPAPFAQTFTNASGGGAYTVRAGDTPLDPEFRDTRGAFNFGWELPLSSVMRLNLGANLSKEFDYASVSASAGLARDFNLKNTTVSAGISLGRDVIDPVGGAPVPLTTMAAPWRFGEREDANDDGIDDDGLVDGVPIGPAPARLAGDQNKDLVDLLFGVTQVLSPRSILQLNYSIGQSDGYLTDPYKLVSVVDATAGPTEGLPVRHLYESRPDARTKQAVYTAYKHQNQGGDTWELSYRYLWDDWGITSHTLDSRYRWMLGRDTYLQPHLRFYRQTAADFYTRFLEDGAPLPVYASADYRLGEFSATTVGLKWGKVLQDGHELGLQLEYYRQAGDSHPADAIGALRNQDLFPVVDAIMVQVNWSF
jgi:hypothetical protein